MKKLPQQLNHSFLICRWQAKILISSGDAQLFKQLWILVSLLVIFLYTWFTISSMIQSIWQKVMIFRRIDTNCVEELGNLKHHELSIDGDGSDFQKQ